MSKLELGAKAEAEKVAGCRLRHGTRKNTAGLPGTPDWFSRKNKVVVFIHGCFWHGCPEHRRQPKNNAEFWRDKIAATRGRDLRVQGEYLGMGWRVIPIWEHSLKRLHTP